MLRTFNPSLSSWPQVSSQNATQTPATGNDTTVTMSYNSTMMHTSAYGSLANATTPKGAASFTRSGAFSILLPVAMAATLVFSRC